MSDNFYSKMFFLGALWNIGAALVGLFFPKFQFCLFFGPDAFTGDFYQVLLFRAFFLAVLFFGIGYYMVSRELFLNRGIVWLGAVAKLFLFGMFSYYFILEKVTLMGFLVLFGDFLWAILFFMFLYQTRDRVRLNIFVG